jgi:Ca2+-binding EF-hand superfamily protein
MTSELRIKKLTKLFTMYDAQNHGILQLSDFERIVHKLAEIRGWNSGQQEYENLLNKYAYRWITMRAEIKQKINKEINSQIDLDEWLRYHELLQEDEAYQWEVKILADLIFDVIDLDDSSSLDKHEWKILFQVFNIPVVYVNETFAKIDSNHDEMLTKQEVMPLLEEFYFSDDPNAAGNGMFGPF